jgi:hypothetical protein
MNPKRSKGYAAWLSIAYLFWPFGGLLAAFYNFRRNSSAIYFVAFFMLYGYTLVYSQNMDAARYEAQFRYIASLGPGQIEAPGSEYFLTAIMYLVSRLTENTRVFLAVIAFFYSLPFVLGLRILIKEMPRQRNFILLYFLAAYFLFIPIASIVGIRFHTAAFFFVYVALRIVVQQDKSLKTILIAVFTVFIHWSFVYPLLFLGVYSFFGSKRRLAFTVLIFSILYRFLVPFDLGAYVGLLGETFSERYDVYTMDSFVEARTSRISEIRNYVAIRGDLMFFFIILVLVVHYFKWFGLRTDEKSERFYTFMLYMVAMVNFASSNMISNERFLQLTSFLGLAYLFFLMLVNYRRSAAKILFYFSLIPFGLNLWVNTRYNFETIDPLLVIGNIYFILTTDGSETLLQLLGK